MDREINNKIQQRPINMFPRQNVTINNYFEQLFCKAFK